LRSCPHIAVSTIGIKTGYSSMRRNHLTIGIPQAAWHRT
jgi:hypothetical protein